VHSWQKQTGGDRVITVVVDDDYQLARSVAAALDAGNFSALSRTAIRTIVCDAARAGPTTLCTRIMSYGRSFGQHAAPSQIRGNISHGTDLVDRVKDRVQFLPCICLHNATCVVARCLSVLRTGVRLTVGCIETAEPSLNNQH